METAACLFSDKSPLLLAATTPHKTGCRLTIQHIIILPAVPLPWARR
jgi:hypothetical protein